MATPQQGAGDMETQAPRGGGMQLQSGEIYLPNYRLGKTLGIGSFGKVKLAEHAATTHKVAVKILNRRRITQIDMHEKVRREIKILHLFMHPHIIRLYEVIETSQDIFVVMEYVKSGELFDYIVEKGRLHEEEARRFFQQIIGGVEYCHRSMVVHRDLKPENLLLDSNLNIKIADFGLSNMMTDGHFLKTSCGSPNYAAPEVISGRLYAGPEVDVWSCGVILYALLCGSLPFDDENIPTLFKRIKGGIYTIPSFLSPNARDLIPRMLYVDPLKRITIPEIRMHPWFLQNLPKYLTAAPPDPLSQSLKVDDDVLEAVVRMGYDRNQVLDALKARLCNNATVSYHLMRDNRRHLAKSSGSQQGPDGTNQYRTEGPQQQQMMRASQPAQNRPFAQRLVAHRCWTPGLVVSHHHPSQILGHLMRIMKEKKIQWKKLSQYMYRCRWECLRESTGKLSIVRFELAIYRTGDKRYLVDAQILDGPMFYFLTLCSELMGILRS